MTIDEALVIVKRKARYAFQTEFALIFTSNDADAILAENTRTEKVYTEAEDGTFSWVDTAVYDTTSAAIACLESVAPFAAIAKSIGGVSVSYETIQLAINRLKSSQFAPISMSTVEERQRDLGYAPDDMPEVHN